MIKREVFILLLLICFLNVTKPVYANLIINEVYPNPLDEEKEWIEIYNTSSEEKVSLTGYVIKDEANNSFGVDGILEPNSYYLATPPSNILNNNGKENVYIKDSNQQNIDVFTYETSEKGLSWSRCGNQIIKTVQSPAFVNICPTIFPTPTSSLPTDVIAPNPSSTPNFISYNNIHLSEVMIDPESGENEWVEIYNANDFPVSLANWYLDDVENSGSSPRTFSLDVPAKSYSVVELSSSVFNNNGDSVRLLDFEKNLKDSFEYHLSEKGKTWGRISFDSDNYCLQEPSKGSVNNQCLNPTTADTSSPTLTKIPSPTNTPTPIGFTSKAPKPSTYRPANLLTDNETTKSSSNNQTGQVLGEITEKADNRHLPLVKSLSFTSLSFSLLTIFSVFLKMKFKHD